MSTKHWIRGKAPAWMIGGSVICLVTLLHSRQAFDPLTYLQLDHAFKTVNNIKPSDKIVLIDIDDTAVKRIKGWPWPRRMYAELIDGLNELGAERILLDFLFDVPQAPRLEHPMLQPDVDVAPDRHIYGQVNLDDAIRDDDEFAMSMARAGNVYLAFYFTPSPPGVDLNGLFESIQHRAQSHIGIPFNDLIENVIHGNPNLPDDFDLERFVALAVISQHLHNDFSRTVEHICESTAFSEELVSLHFAAAKRLAARRIVHDLLIANPNLSFAKVLSHVLPNQAYDEHNADREDVLRAYRIALGELASLSHRPTVPQQLHDLIPTGWDPTPPLEKLARTAHSVGYVTFENDSENQGGIFRRVPLVIDLQNHLIPQLGFSMACDHLGIDWELQLELDGKRLVLAGDNGEAYRIKLDDGGRMLINWHFDHAADNPGDWTNSFSHIPVTMIYQVAARRAEIDENRRRSGHLMAKWILNHDQEFFEQVYVGPVRERNGLERYLKSNYTSEDEKREVLARIAELNSQITDIEQTYIDSVVQKVNPSENSPPDEEVSEQELHDAKTLLNAHRVVTEINPRLSAEVSTLLDDLRPRIEGKLCFLGYTATAVADIVNSPVYQKMPGVLAHANVVNSFLQNRFVYEANVWTSYALLVICGLVVTLTTVRYPAGINFSIMLVISGSVFVLTYWLFRSRGVFLASIPAASGTFLCWAFVTLYRLLAEERLRRRFARSLSRNTSPALARQIAETAEDLSLEPRPEEVSCLFSDLAGFTTISERLGPDQTQAILNRYLQTMSDVLLPHRAINKFMGDGIFAFFNAPVWPCSDHAREAIEAALDCRDALAELKETEAGGQFAAEFAALEMRIGINTGTAFVGEFGSDHQIDYTCIGDSINLGARLEPANKAFDTSILVSEFTRQAASDEFAFRHLGGLQVKGKRLAVPVYELLGRVDEMDDWKSTFVQSFEEGVMRFQERDWNAAAKAFTKCDSAKPNDAGVQLYLQQIALYSGSPPPADWNQAIELTTK
jgi:class 3 adenylate cyclase/CHASE2 domain-containing sensor protein